MTFTPFVGPLASALGGDREGALLSCGCCITRTEQEGRWC